MSVGARHGTLLAEIQAEFDRITGLGLFHFPHWYSEQVRALKASMGHRFPSSRPKHEQALLEILRATPTRT
mgnify:CR=1 FL=1